MFKENKYKKWYFNIINSALKNNILEGEKHHIIPKSLGGTNKKNNIVFLTYRQHFVCHLLLPKFLIDENHIYKMKWAIHRMAFSNKNKLKSVEYEIARKIHIKNITENHPSKNDPNWIKKHSENIKKSYKNNKDLRNIRSKKFLENWGNDKIREKLIIHNKNISKLGAEAAKKSLTGKLRPGTGLSGQKNPMSKRFLILTPSGIVEETFCLKEYCIKNNLNYNGMINLSCGKIKQYKKYVIIEKGDSSNG